MITKSLFYCIQYLGIPKKLLKYKNLYNKKRTQGYSQKRMLDY